MGLGSTAKRVQKMVELAESLYERVIELREQVAAMRETVDDTNGRVAELETELAEQRALLEAVAESQGVDPAAADGGAETADDAPAAAED